MKSRLLVAAVGIPLLLVILFVCPKIVTTLAICLLSAIGIRELLYTTGIAAQKTMLYAAMDMGVFLPLCCYFGLSLTAMTGLTVVFALIVFIEALRTYPEVRFASVSGTLFAGVAIPLCLGSIARILGLEQGRYLVLVPILIPFLSDAGAYFVGCGMGKHKLAPALSPNNTVEGAVGGLLTGIAAMMIYGIVIRFGFQLTYNFLYGAVYGLVGAAVSIVGDLSFSMIKRETGIKDYGTLFRAHGGVLDRFDSVIFAAPVVELLLYLLPLLEV